MPSLLPASAGFLHGLILYPKDRGDMFLPYIGLSRHYVTSQPGKPYSSMEYTSYNALNPDYCMLNGSFTRMNVYIMTITNKAETSS
jgi:hypothetical protein